MGSLIDVCSSIVSCIISLRCVLFLFFLCYLLFYVVLNVRMSYLFVKGYITTCAVSGKKRHSNVNCYNSKNACQFCLKFYMQIRNKPTRTGTLLRRNVLQRQFYYHLKYSTENMKFPTRQLRFDLLQAFERCDFRVSVFCLRTACPAQARVVRRLTA